MRKVRIGRGVANPTKSGYNRLRYPLRIPLTVSGTIAFSAGVHKINQFFFGLRNSI